MEAPNDVMSQVARPNQLKWPILKPDDPAGDAPAVRLNRTSCVVGDRSRVHLPLPSPMVSRAHALIVIDDDEVYVRDLASRNKLFVNSLPVREAALKSADLMEIGPYRFRCWAGFNGGTTDIDEAPIQGRLTFAGSGRKHAIDSRTLLIGRRAECDVTLTLQTVSRVHAIIFRRGGRHYVRDLNSKAGTLVNGERIREAELNDGDELKIAAFSIRYNCGADADGNGDAHAVGRSNGELAPADAWPSGSGLLSGTGLLSGSATMGSKSALLGGSGSELGGTQEAAPAGPLATPDDLGLSDPGISTALAGGSYYGELSADPAELFPSEMDLPPALGFSGSDDASPPRPQNGNGSH